MIWLLIDARPHTIQMRGVYAAYAKKKISSIGMLHLTCARDMAGVDTGTACLLNLCDCRSWPQRQSSITRVNPCAHRLSLLACTPMENAGYGDAYAGRHQHVSARCSSAVPMVFSVSCARHWSAHSKSDHLQRQEASISPQTGYPYPYPYPYNLFPYRLQLIDDMRYNL